MTEGQRHSEGYPSGQREQTVNLPSYDFEGSNPSPSTLYGARPVLDRPGRARLANTKLSERIAIIEDRGGDETPSFVLEECGLLENLGFHKFAGTAGVKFCGSSSVGRASAFQAECREFESRLPLHLYRRPASRALACSRSADASKTLRVSKAASREESVLGQRPAREASLSPKRRPLARMPLSLANFPRRRAGKARREPAPSVLVYVRNGSGGATPPARMDRKVCPRGSVVEHFLGKEGVASSILAVGFLYAARCRRALSRVLRTLLPVATGDGGRARFSRFALAA